MTFTDEAEAAGRALMKAGQAFQNAGDEIVRMTRRRTRYRQSVTGRFDMASKVTRATLTIDAAGTVSVRPYRKWRTYSVPVDAVAQWIVRQQIAAEVRAKKAPRRRRSR